MFPNIYLNLEYFPTNIFRVKNLCFQETAEYSTRQQRHNYGNVQRTSAET
jgi:hypothetical protein